MSVDATGSDCYNGAVVVCPADDERYKLLRQVGILLSIPMMLVCGPVVGFLLGRGVELLLPVVEPAGVIVGIVIGFAASARETWRLIKRAERDDS